MHRWALLLLLGLAACGTPQDRCSRSLTTEAKRIDRLISETRTNIARGYRYEVETRTVQVGFSYCNFSRNIGLCLDNQPRSVRKAVAIDPDAEQRKLNSLLLKREQLTSATCSADGRPISVPAL